MRGERYGQTAVIFVSQRTTRDEPGYHEASAAMATLAAAQPGYRGMTSVRDAAGLGITVSYWADDASAKAWRDHPEHERTREAGRDRWYAHYTIDVATVTRGYGWQK
jgi:heme-degrading monooxygenase HmoA